MPKIIIYNKNQFSKYSSEIEIFGDNKRVGKIASGRTLEFDVKPGVHSLYAKLGIFVSRKKIFEIDNNNNTEKEFFITKPKSSLPLAVIAFASLIYVSVFWYLDLKIIFVLAVAYLFYYMFFGFNRYFRLKEIK